MTETQRAMFAAHLHLVKKVSHRLVPHWRPWLREEAQAAGLYGLWLAVLRCKNTVNFPYYARRHIQGQITSWFFQCHVWVRRGLEATGKPRCGEKVFLTVDGDLDATEGSNSTPGRWDDELEDALNELSEADRTLLLEYYYGNHSQQEIGAARGIGAPAVNNRLKRALNKLKTTFTRLGYVPIPGGAEMSHRANR